MSDASAVSDAGPLLALAKLEALDLLAQLYNVVYVSPIVFQETVVAGLAQDAPDALLLQKYFDRGIFKSEPVQSPSSLNESLKIHKGERESIQLALQLRIPEFLVDDARARRVAEQNFASVQSKITVRGTLGVIFLNFQKRSLSRDRAVHLIETIKLRRDIWISAELCERVLHLIRA